MNYQFVLDDNNQFSLCPIEAVAEKSKKNKINEMLIDACKLGSVEKVIDLIETKGTDLHLADLSLVLNLIRLVITRCTLLLQMDITIL